MSTKQIASSTLWQIASQVTMAALSIITIKFVAIGLSKEMAGNYHSAYGFLQLFGILADFGLYAVSVREVSRAPEQSSMHGGQNSRADVMGGLVILRMIILALSLGSALLLAWLLPLWQGTPLPLGITVAALVPFFTLLSGIQRTVFQVYYKMYFVFIAEVTQRIITVALIAGVVLMGTRGSDDPKIYLLFLGAGGIGALVLFFLSTIFARSLLKIRLRWNAELMKSLFKHAAPYGVAFLCTALYRQLDVTLIALLRPDYELQNAYYGFALRAVEMGYLFPTFLLNSTLPILSKRDNDGEDTRVFVGKIFFAIALLGSTLLLFSFIWARPLILLLTSPEYLSSIEHAGSDTALRLLAVPMLLNGIVLFSFYSLLTKHAWKPLVTTLLIGAALSLALNVFLIPRDGFVGAGTASIITNIFLALVLLPQSLRILPMKFSASMVGQWTLFSIVLGGVLWALRPFLTSNVWTAVGLALTGLFLLFVAYILRIHRTLKIK